MSQPDTLMGLFERFVTAQETKATALTQIAEAVSNFELTKIGDFMHAASSGPEPDADETAEAPTLTVVDQDEPDETQEPVAEPEEPAAEPEPEPEPEETAAEPEEDETPAEAPAEDDAEAGEVDPLGDGEAGDASDEGEIVIPEDLSTDHVRELARQVMEAENKIAVFEVLASIGGGYKAVGEIAGKDLEAAYLAFANRLQSGG